jgi:hypothetical protein
MFIAPVVDSTVRIAHRADRGHHAGFLAALAERIARILTARIGMVDNPLGSALNQRHLKRRQDQLRAQMRFHGPTDNAPRVHIQHHRQIQKSRPGRDERDISYPEPVRGFSEEAPLHQVRRAFRLRIARGGDYEPSQARAPKSGLAHQASNTLASNADAIVVCQFRMDHRRAIHATRSAMYLLDFLRQPQVSTGPRTHRPIAPRVIPTSRNSQHSAHCPDRMGGLIRLHEPEERFEGAPSVAVGSRTGAPG